MTTQSVSNNAYLSSLNQPAQSPDKGLGQKDFLRLMVAQVQHQDPMQPQANGEFLAQLAQFSTNDGINRMQNSLQEMAFSMQSNQALQASALVGRQVLVESNQLNLDADGSPKIGIEPPAGVSDVTAFIYSETGELISKFPIENTKAGFSEFSWNGLNQNNERAPAGKYKVEVHCTYAGKEEQLITSTTSRVNSVSLGQNGEGLRLNVDGMGSVLLKDVKQISL